MYQGLNYKAKTIQFLEDNININLHDLGYGEVFLNMTPKTQATYKNNFFFKIWVPLKVKLCDYKDTIKRVNREPIA